MSAAHQQGSKVDDGETSPGVAIEALLDIMARLRDPVSGCAWDREQTSASIARYAIEEAYEVVEAIESGDPDELKNELGDLLFQVVFHARMAEEAGLFAFTDVVRAVSDKMIDRHPHVFAGATIQQAEEQERAWETLKAEERRAKALAEGRAPSVLDDVPAALPALMRAQKLAKRAARVGFDYPDSESARAKVVEELDELREAIASNDGQAISEELGDVLFSAACVAMKIKTDAEETLRNANAKFERRFRAVEAALAAEGLAPQDVTLERMDAIWNAVKQAESEAKTLSSAES